MITVEYTTPRKINLCAGTSIIDKAPLEAVLKELDKHKLLSSSGGEWVRLTNHAGGNYSVGKINIAINNDNHLALVIIWIEKGSHNTFEDIRFYELKSK